MYPISITNVIVNITNVFAFHRSITFVNTLGSRLRYARTLRGLTQAQLARACGLSQGAIGNYESDRRRNAKDVFRIAEVLKVSAAWLAMGTEPMEMSAAHTLAEHTPLAAGMTAWPFPDVEPDRIWALPAKQRMTLNNILATALAGLEEDGAGPSPT